MGSGASWKSSAMLDEEMNDSLTTFLGTMSCLTVQLLANVRSSLGVLEEQATFGAESASLC